MRSSSCTVLDLGSTKVACLVAEADEEGGMDVIAAATVPCKGMRKGAVVDMDETARAIDSAVRKLQADGANVGPLVVAVGGQHIDGCTSQGFVPIYPRSRTITREDVLQVVKHSRQLMIPPDREQIQVLPGEFRIDGQRGIKKPLGMSGGKLEVTSYIVTGQIAHLQNLEKVVEMHGRRVAEMVLLPLASGLGVLSPDEMEHGVVVADIGGSSTDIAVLVGGGLVYAASVPVGGALVSSDILKLLKTSPEEAERLKVSYGHAKADLVPEAEKVDVLQLGQTEARPLQRRVLCEIIESRMRELAVLIRQQMQRSGFFGMLPAGLVLTGGGSRLPGSKECFEEVLQHIKVRTGSPRVGGDHGKTTDTPEMATAVGLARFALGMSEDELTTVDGIGDWKDRIKTFWSLLSGRA
ncbi:MAG TPA: cell division protein FtsA [Fimbriimonadaceae bacterium]|nr:cell division protein FtsA [Fimbriimonadaceae bacterium]